MTGSMRTRVPNQQRRQQASGARLTARDASQRRRGLLSIFLIALIAALLGSGCLSPTLPLPPPDVTSMHLSAEGEGVWAISGECIAGALVTVFNETTGEGAVIEDRAMTGKFTVFIKASACDLAWAKQDQGSETSTHSTSFVVQDVTGSAPTDPSACKSAE